MSVYKPSKNRRTWWYEFQFEGQGVSASRDRWPCVSDAILRSYVLVQRRSIPLIGAEWLREWSGIENGKSGKDAGKE